MGELTPEERIQQVREQAKSVQTKKDIVGLSSTASDAVEFAINPLELLAEKIGTELGEGLAKSINAKGKATALLDFIGLDRIGLQQGETPHPATVTLQVAHSHAMWGFLGAVVVGALAAVAVGALIVASGGTALVVMAGAAAAGGFAGGFAGEALVGAAANFGEHVGPIITGSPNVFIGGWPAARMTDTADCEDHRSPPSPIVEGSETIFINSLPLARVGHKLLCGAVIDEGVQTVVVDKSTVQCAEPDTEIPLWLSLAADWLPLGLDAVKIKPSKVDAPKVEPPKMAVPEGAPPKVDPPKVDLPKVDPPKVDPPKVDPPKVDPPKVDPPKVDPPKVDPPKVDPPKVDPPKVDPPKVDPPKVDPPKVDPPKVDPPKVDPPAVDPPKVDPPAVDPPKVDPPKVDPPAVDPPAADPPVVDPPAADPPVVDPPVVDPPKVDPPAVDPPKVDPPKRPPIPQNPADPPGPGWEWRGKGEPGSPQGSWYNPSTGESVHPDLNHGPPIGPHWDYKDPDGKLWRVFEDGRMEPK